MKKESKITYASIVPLIGGESIGIMNAMGGQLPEYVLSYEAFKNNDIHYINYIREKKGWDGDYVVLDSEEFANYRPKNVDVVNSVCPCAGLSSLSVSSAADNPTNEWLYTTAEYVLEHVKPKVFWGENAPRLYSNVGKKVADKLHEIGQKYGYALNLYYTESKLHGLAQKRPRTFYFFTKGDYAPILKTWRRDVTPIEKILKKRIRVRDPMNVPTTDKDPINNAWVAYALHIHGVKTIKELYDKLESTQNLIAGADKKFGQNLNEVGDWMEANGHEHVGKRARAMQKKLDDGKGYWAHGVTVPKGIVPSLIGAMPVSLINPFTEKFLTLRDCLRMMGMPDDFNLSHDNPVRVTNHICQNVPVGTAKDMMESVMDYLEGNCDTSGATYIKQTNKKDSWEAVITENNTHELTEFFKLKKQ